MIIGKDLIVITNSSAFHGQIGLITGVDYLTGEILVRVNGFDIEVDSKDIRPATRFFDKLHYWFSI